MEGEKSKKRKKEVKPVVKESFIVSIEEGKFVIEF